MKKGELISRTSEERPDIKTTALAAWRSEIISSILQNGLKPQATLINENAQFLGSGDKPSDGQSAYIEGVILAMNETENIESQIQAALYQSDTHSLFPVIIERPDEPLAWINEVKLNKPNKGKISKIIQERLSASFLVVCRLGDDKEFTSGRSVVTGKSESLIPKDSFAYLVFPEDIWKEYQETKLGMQEQEVPAKLVKMIFEKDVFRDGLSLEVPNYERALMEIVEEIGGSIWVHAVRLPTKDDLQRLRLIPQEED